MLAGSTGNVENGVASRMEFPQQRRYVPRLGRVVLESRIDQVVVLGRSVEHRRKLHRRAALLQRDRTAVGLHVEGRAAAVDRAVQRSSSRKVAVGGHRKVAVE